MALNRVGQDTISKGAQTAQTFIDLIGLLDQLNVLYDSAGGIKETTTQEELDEIASLAGITKAQLDDAMYQLTAIIRPALHDGFTALAHLAARA